jgi:glyoxylate/hydroxypyruvate reductase A
MNVLLYCNFANSKKWEKAVRKKFRGENVYTLSDNPELEKIDCAIIWNIPNDILGKLTNLKIIFSMGAGVDHILKLANYNETPIIRVKDPSMAVRMSYHVLSQILEYQLNLKYFYNAQLKKNWLENLQYEKQVKLNNEITVGILGVGFLGSYVGKYLKKLEYNVIGLKNSISKTKNSFPIFTSIKKNYFIKNSNIIVAILPSTKNTNNFINVDFLKKMKKKSLLINVGRGSTINEKDLINHVKKNKDFFASLDVFKNEPLPKSNPLWLSKNITITPHVASLTVVDIIVEQMHKSLLNYKKNKKIKNDVDLGKGY